VTVEVDSSPAPWRSAVAAAFLAWMLDAFDYFLVVFVLERIAHDFATGVKEVTFALFLTLAFRPLGAFLFGRIADRLGRRPALMASVIVYSVMELGSALSPSLAVFLALRALFGIGMGGAWGVGASLAFESIPVRFRGTVSGFLQSGYPTGYLFAAVVFGLLVPVIGWRGMLMVGAAPALLSWFILARVPESPTWLAARRGGGIVHPAPAPGDGPGAPEDGRSAGGGMGPMLVKHWRLALYAVLLMTAFNFFSHGTQDLYPTFLTVQRGLSTGTVSRIAILYNLGAIGGGIIFGRLSSRIGRRRAVALAALLALPALPFWAFSTSAAGIAAAAFVMQFMVQGAWGVVPVHLNELSPQGVRATFPGVVYQLGNLVAAANAPIQAYIAAWRGGSAHPDYAFGLMLVCIVVIPTLIVLALAGPEQRGVRF
jgi:MFS transporter, SHS family, lactate transporter